MKKHLILLIIILFEVSLSAQALEQKYELRGAWIATVVNIDWPSNRNTSTNEQIVELMSLFNQLEAAGINAVFFQVRCESDALYKSQIEPWSFWLTGEQGKAPEPFFDPLELAISEAHKRGMELHAWFNPYRAIKSFGQYEQAQNHVSVQHPEWLLKIGKYRMLNPGIPEVEKYILSIIEDVLKRYDVDGIHFDDYFYPYSPIKNEDALTFSNYNKGIKSIADWRRDNVNSLIKKTHLLINSLKPYVKFGISPFGIVKNKFAGTKGLEAYKTLYCNPLNWIENKTIDYISPQLYWSFTSRSAPYGKLIKWWNEVVKDRHLYPGIFSSYFAERGKREVKNVLGKQISVNRKYKNTLGEVHFSARAISLNWGNLKDFLIQRYKYPALPPIMKWKKNQNPAPLKEIGIAMEEGYVKLSWETPEIDFSQSFPAYYIIYRFEKNEKVDFSNPEKIIKVVSSNQKIFYDTTILKNGETYTYIVKSADRLFNECNESPLKAIIYNP